MRQGEFPGDEVEHGGHGSHRPVAVCVRFTAEKMLFESYPRVQPLGSHSGASGCNIADFIADVRQTPATGVSSI